MVQRISVILTGSLSVVTNDQFRRLAVCAVGDSLMACRLPSTACSTSFSADLARS
jgi:hypothetical protein